MGLMRAVIDSWDEERDGLFDVHVESDKVLSYEAYMQAHNASGSAQQGVTYKHLEPLSEAVVSTRTYTHTRHTRTHTHTHSRCTRATSCSPPTYTTSYYDPPSLPHPL